MEGGLAALQPAAPGIRALCHLLMSSQGEAGPNPSLSQGTETGSCPVAKGSYSHEHSSHRLIIMLHYSNTNIKIYATVFLKMQNRKRSAEMYGLKPEHADVNLKTGGKKKYRH